MDEYEAKTGISIPIHGVLLILSLDLPLASAMIDALSFFTVDAASGGFVAPFGTLLAFL